MCALAPVRFPPTAAFAVRWFSFRKAYGLLRGLIAAVSPHEGGPAGTRLGCCLVAWVRFVDCVCCRGREVFGGVVGAVLGRGCVLTCPQHSSYRLCLTMGVSPCSFGRRGHPASAVRSEADVRRLMALCKVARKCTGVMFCQRVRRCRRPCSRCNQLQ